MENHYHPALFLSSESEEILSATKNITSVFQPRPEIIKNAFVFVHLFNGLLYDS